MSHDQYRANPPPSSCVKDQYRNKLLNNVRESIIYLGEDIAIPNAIDYMYGGTRPLAPHRDEALRNNKFFQNVHSPVFYEPEIPYRHI